MGRMRYLLVGGSLLVLLVAGCGRKAEEAAPPTSSAEAPQRAAAAKVFDPAEAATVKGRVLFEGEAPAPRELPIRGNPECSVLHPGGKALSEELMVKDGLLKNVFIYVKEGLEGRHFDPPSEPVTLSNKNCLYVPHVVGLQVGQPLVLLNEDATLHNVHSFSKNSAPFNLGLPFQGMKQTKKFSSAEVMVTMKCDVHPWMLGYVGVLTHPYFSVSGEDGGFELKGLPPGEYFIEAWHEKLGVQTQKIQVGSRETKEIEFKF